MNEWENSQGEQDAAELREVVTELQVLAGAELGAQQIETFADAGVMTSDQGFIVRFSNGSEFQVTVVRSR